MQEEDTGGSGESKPCAPSAKKMLVCAPLDISLSQELQALGMQEGQALVTPLDNPPPPTHHKMILRGETFTFVVCCSGES